MRLTTAFGGTGHFRELSYRRGSDSLLAGHDENTATARPLPEQTRTYVAQLAPTVVADSLVAARRDVYLRGFAPADDPRRTVTRC